MNCHTFEFRNKDEANLFSSRMQNAGLTVLIHQNDQGLWKVIVCQEKDEIGAKKPRKTVQKKPVQKKPVKKCRVEWVESYPHSRCYRCQKTTRSSLDSLCDDCDRQICKPLRHRARRHYPLDENISPWQEDAIRILEEDR